MRIRTRLFLAAFGIATLSLLLAVALASRSLERQLLERIEGELAAETRLVAELVSRLGPDVSLVELDEEADLLAIEIGARITLVAEDGQVLADSAEDGLGLAAMENHGNRPEIQSARRLGLGTSRRFSTTVENNLLYIAVAIDHPLLAFARLALPLTAIDDQVASMQRSTVAGLFAALAGALVLAWVTSSAMSKRVNSIVSNARRYADGDLTPRFGDYGNDEIGVVARALDGSVRELTRRMSELSRNRLLTDAILSGMAEGVLVVNTDGHVQIANDSVREMLLFEKEPVGKHYVDLINQQDLVERLRIALQDGQTDRAEIEIGTMPVKVYLASATPLVSKDSPGIVLVLYDVTDYRKTEQIRRDFVANVSHELRTPLTAIRGSVEALMEDQNVQTDDNRFLDIISRHTTRMERLVRDLLRLTRLDAGQDPINLSELSTISLFAGVQAELKPILNEKLLRVEVDISPSAETVKADSAKLHDAIKNLVENAAHYAPVESNVTLSACRTNDGLVLAIKDRGPGIPDDDLPRVFERFYRVERSRVRNPGGTGLGLAIVKHLVELHGGTVVVLPRAGGGSSFIVTLPQDDTLISSSSDV